MAKQNVFLRGKAGDPERQRARLACLLSCHQNTATILHFSDVDGFYSLLLALHMYVCMHVCIFIIFEKNSLYSLGTKEPFFNQ